MTAAYYGGRQSYQDGAKGPIHIELHPARRGGGVATQSYSTSQGCQRYDANALTVAMLPHGLGSTNTPVWSEQGMVGAVGDARDGAQGGL